MDDELGLINMNARMYDPKLGRFLQADSIVPDAGHSQAFNRYSYVLNNPLSLTDPTGMCSNSSQNSYDNNSNSNTSSYVNWQYCTTNDDLYSTGYSSYYRGNREHEPLYNFWDMHINNVINSLEESDAMLWEAINNIGYNNNQVEINAVATNTGSEPGSFEWAVANGVFNTVADNRQLANSNSQQAVNSMSSNGLDMLKGWETIGGTPNLNAYYDTGSYGTIGYGHKIKWNEDFSEGITSKKAEELLVADVASAERAVRNLVDIPLNKKQFDALTMLVYNIGEDNFAFSLTRAYINAGNFSQAMSEWRGFRLVNGNIDRGLVRRRRAETQLFMKGVYDYNGIKR